MKKFLLNLSFMTRLLSAGYSTECEDINLANIGFSNGEETGDVNHSGKISITDIVIIIDNILKGE